MSRKRPIIAGVLAAASAVVFALVGVELIFAIAWGGILGAGLLLTQIVLDDVDEAPPADTAKPQRRGSDVSRMAWSINPRTGLAGEIITRRVRGILIRRLNRHGIDPTDPAQRPEVDLRLGAGLWERLTTGKAAVADLERALDAIDRLPPAQEEHR